MKLIVALLTMVISFVLLPAVCYTPSVFAQTDYGGEFDLNYCQYECRMRYGKEPSGSVGYSQEDSDESWQLHQSSPTYYQYANCLADCQRRARQELERKSGESGKTR